MGKLKFSLVTPPAGEKFAQPKVLLATWFGSGLIRPAPGTMGTFTGLPFGYAIALLWGDAALAVAALVLLVLGTFAATWYGKKSGQTDDQSIVVDEVVGVWIAALPAEHSISLWILAALLFRLFDIWKPWPVSLFDERSSGGFDVMMDDVVAGIYALFGVAIAALYSYT
jgi:phosphatidylglycerophosphatase A